MARPDKAAVVAELTEKFRAASAVLLTEYRGLTVTQLKELRRSIGDAGSYEVAKNTLATIAAREAGLEGLDEYLSGPTAITFVSGEAVDAAKAIRDFAKENDKLVIKAGYMDGQVLSESGVKELADLESREVLLGKAAGAFKGKLFQAAYLFTAGPAKAVRTIEALREKQESEAA